MNQPNGAPSTVNAMTAALAAVLPHAPANVGAVNFDSNLVTEDAQAEARVVNAAPPVEARVNIGGSRQLGEVPAQIVPATLSPEPIHKIKMSLCLTLNSGFTILKGLKNLKNVEVDRGPDDKHDWNFYNPFQRADVAKDSGEGLLRNCLKYVAKNAYELVGVPCNGLDHISDIDARIGSATEAIRCAVEEGLFPLMPNDYICTVAVPVGDSEIPRDIHFRDLFSVNSWVVKQQQRGAAFIEHLVTVNIMLNVGAFYDSREPHAFVQKAHHYLESVLTNLGINDKIAYHVVVGVDSSKLFEQRTRDLLDMLVIDNHYEIVSKAKVLDGAHDWISSGDAPKLFGFGCDVALVSPLPSFEPEAEGE